MKNRYPIRSNRGQPPSTSDVHSPNFQFNQISSDLESVVLPQNIQIYQGDVFNNMNTNFGHCVSSDLVMGAGIARNFLRLFPDLNEVRKKNKFLPPGSLIAHYSQQRKNWIYNLITKQRYNHKPTYRDLHKSLCRMKSHMLTHGVKEISLPQIGCGLDALEWTKVLTSIIQIFDNSGICVKVFLRSCNSKPNIENSFVAEEYDNNHETNKHVFHMCTARKLAFEGMMKSHSSHNTKETLHTELKTATKI